MSHADPQMNFRLPADLRARLKAEAFCNRRTLTAEITSRLESTFVDLHSANDAITRVNDMKSNPSVVERAAERRERIATMAPITFEVVAQEFRASPPFDRAADRSAFFAVWALLSVEWADALTAELDREKGE